MKSYLLKGEISFSLRKFFGAWALSLTIGPKLIDLKTSLFNKFISTELFWKEFVMNIIIVTKI